MVLACFVFVSWNTLYSLKIVLMEKSSYGTPCIQSLGCLLLQCVCKYQILGPPEVGGRGDTRAPPPATNPLIVGVSCCCAANLHTLPWPVSSNSGDIWHAAINLSCSSEPIKTKGGWDGGWWWEVDQSRVTETVTLFWLGSSGAWNLCFFDFWHWILLQFAMTHHDQILWNIVKHGTVQSV